MKRLSLAVFATLALLAAAALAHAETEVKMAGDARIHVNSWTNYNFTGWNANGTATAEQLSIYERFRLRTDFSANENLKFRFGMRANDLAWGNGFIIDSPQIAIQVDQAYLQFKCPITGINVTAGYQDWANPQASYFMGGLIMDTQISALAMDYGFGDAFTLKFGYLRPLQTYPNTFPTTTPLPSTLDALYLAGEINLDPIKVTPYVIAASVGQNTNLNVSTVYNSMLSPASAALTPALAWQNGYNMYYWIGGSFEVKAFDPLKIYADVIYGNGCSGDRAYNNRQGWFIDFAVEYSGWDAVTPSLWGLWSTGDTSGLSGGSQRMPNLVSSWNAGNAFTFNTNALVWYNDALNIQPIGTWGLGLTLDKISFLNDLTHRLTFNFVNGNNSPSAVRQGNLLAGTGNFYGLGITLATTEWVYALEFDNTYKLYENLSLIGQLGWAHGNFDQSIWGRRFYNAANNGDVWRILVGFKYEF